MRKHKKHAKGAQQKRTFTHKNLTSANICKSAGTALDWYFQLYRALMVVYLSFIFPPFLFDAKYLFSAVSTELFYDFISSLSYNTLSAENAMH